MTGCPSTVFCTRFSVWKVPNTCIFCFPPFTRTAASSSASSKQASKQRRHGAGTGPAISLKFCSLLDKSGAFTPEVCIFLCGSVPLSAVPARYPSRAGRRPARRAAHRVQSVCLVFMNHPGPKMGAAASGSHEVVSEHRPRVQPIPTRRYDRQVPAGCPCPWFSSVHPFYFKDTGLRDPALRRWVCFFCCFMPADYGPVFPYKEVAKSCQLQKIGSFRVPESVPDGT